MPPSRLQAESLFPPLTGKLAGMGYQDREYMRGEGSGTDAGRSNPLWWILGLIALILVVAYFRRGAISSGRLQALRETADFAMPTQTCRIELASSPHPPAGLLPVLKEFFHQQGYDSTIHETADGTLTAASFLRQSESDLWSQNAVYQHIGPGHTTRKARHTLEFQMHPGTSAPGVLIAQAQEVSQQLLLRLAAEFPGLVLSVDDTPRPVAYDDHE